MALIFLGKTSCALCGRLLQPGEPIRGLPPLADNAHPLWPYFDQGFHAECFENWRHKAEVLALVQQQEDAHRNSDAYREMVRRTGKPGWLGMPD